MCVCVCVRDLLLLSQPTAGADFSIEKASTRWKSLDSKNDQVIIRLEEVVSTSVYIHKYVNDCGEYNNNKINVVFL